ncbi:Glutaconyl-CoA decarboxylase subunit gamma [bioreactor metagenome]|uniref:Glutaconyl-CoA decarboxylase subunit gamma n=1 Tax=bioreactor metagenome TaxID=1076179 RepID=A0A645D5G6_9ZZZZ|nr:acetyl-CoA carboxylase biotin carboxyl carrier protein subunit [Christensenella sp.]
MRNFLVNVNGTQYEVAVEEIDGKAAPAAKPAPAAAPVAAPVAAAAGATKVTAPMPGTILGVNVKEGESVKTGQPIFVLEAMKMESDITAPMNGTVRGINVHKGDSVEAGKLLCTIE